MIVPLPVLLQESWRAVLEVVASAVVAVEAVAAAGEAVEAAPAGAPAAPAGSTTAWMCNR